MLRAFAMASVVTGLVIGSRPGEIAVAQCVRGCRTGTVPVPSGPGCLPACVVAPCGPARYSGLVMAAFTAASNTACPTLEMMHVELDGNHVCWYVIEDCQHPNNPHCMAVADCSDEPCSCDNDGNCDCSDAPNVPGSGGLQAEYDTVRPGGPEPIVRLIRPNWSFTRSLRVSDPAAFAGTIELADGYTLDNFNAASDIVKLSNSIGNYALYRVKKDGTEKVQGIAFRLQGDHTPMNTATLATMSFTEGLILPSDNIAYHVVGLQ